MIEILRRKKTFLFFAIASLVLLAAMGIMRGSMSILDQKFFYMADEARALIESIGDGGRKRYVVINVLDFMFMFFYTGFFFSCYAKFFSNKEHAKVLMILPLMLYIADMLETSMIFYVLWTHPVEPPYLVSFLVLLTPFKWFLALATILVVVNGYVLSKLIKAHQ